MSPESTVTNLLSIRLIVHQVKWLKNSSFEFRFRYRQSVRKNHPPSELTVDKTVEGGRRLPHIFTGVYDMLQYHYNISRIQKLGLHLHSKISKNKILNKLLRKHYWGKIGTIICSANRSVYTYCYVNEWCEIRLSKFILLFLNPFSLYFNNNIKHIHNIIIIIIIIFIRNEGVTVVGYTAPLMIYDLRTYTLSFVRASTSTETLYNSKFSASFVHVASVAYHYRRKAGT